MLSKMLRAKVQNTTIPTVPTDANFNQVSLLLHGDGTNGAQNNTFLDSSTNNFTVTRNGSPTQGTNTPFSQAAGYWSNYFPTTSYLTIATNAAFTYGTGDFTIECWVYLDTTGVLQYVIDQRNSGTANAVIPAIYVSASNVLTYFVSNAAQITGTTTLVVGTWYHVAVARSSTSTKMFLNGVQEGSTYSDSNNYVASRVTINSNGATAGNYLVGYTSNLRLVKGTAVYTANFTPPTTPLTAITNTSLLTCQSNYFKDNSSNNFALTISGTPSVQPFSPFAPTTAYSTNGNGGSIYSLGSNTNYLALPTSTNLLMTGDFTLETYVYIPAGTTQTAYSNIYNGASSPNQGIYSSYSSNNNFGYFGATPSINIQTGIKANDGAWHHIAAVRSGTTLSVYVDGISRGTPATTSANIDLGSATAGRIGAGSNGATDNPFLGYISSLRILNGTALYTANFTPPTAPLTNILNTELLLNGTNAGIYDNAIKNNLTTVGNAQVSTTVVKYGTGSMSFDGTGDWLTSLDTVNLQLGTGKFTIEGWVYLNAVGAARGFVSKGTATTGWSLGTTSLNQVIFNYSSSSITSTGVLLVSTWYFITVVREGTGANQTKIYIDGTNDGTGTVATDFTQTSILYVGADRVGGSALNGYIDDLRITKGVARYTTNFTSPTQAFPNQ
jgi:hypothetical protein